MMAENETSADPGLQLKKRARRRLVGAAALALLAIIVLPVVMDHEPRPPLQDIQVRIPSQDSEGLAPLPAPKPTIPNPTTPNPASLPPPEPEATPVAAPPLATAPLTPPAPLSGSAVTPAVAEPAAEVAQQPQQQWVVQLGTYKDAINVKNLLAKLQEMHVPAYTEKIDADQGARTRVRAGPFTSREAAEKAQTRIKKLGVNGTVAVK
jgi:DedD protein